MAAPARARWLWPALGVVAADQATKFAIERLTGEEFHRAVIPGLLNLVHRHNPGVAFGLLADSESKGVAVLLILVSVGVMAVLAWVLAKDRVSGPGSRTGLAVILGGAGGNLLDRLFRSSVIDFIDFHLRGRHWPAFNLADSAIVIGAALVILDLIRDREPRSRATR